MMTAVSIARQDGAGALSASEAQAEVFWLAFQ